MVAIDSKKQTYMPGLDGLRALAVFIVIGFHLGLPALSGGFLGVALFFVLSGYLITDILLTDWQRKGQANLASFYGRRAKRLLPAVFFLVLCVSVYVPFFRPTLMENLKSAIVPALFFFSNWWYIFQKVPYFASFGTPSLFNHFWSLAIEAQFYLVWPFILLLGHRVIRRRRIMTVLTVLMAIGSAILFGILYQPGTDPGRVYYGTDTRVFSLLLGAALAMACPSQRLTKPLTQKHHRLWLNLGGLTALAAVLCMSNIVTQYSTLLYRGGMLVFSLIALLLIAAAANPSTVLCKVFSLRPLRFLGNISYGVYLWQFPIIALTNNIFRPRDINPALCAGQVVGTILCATLSYYLVEQPVRRGAVFKALRNNSLNELHTALFKTRWWQKATTVCVVLLLAGAIVGLITVHPAAKAATDALSAMPSELSISSSVSVAAAKPPEASPSPTLATTHEAATLHGAQTPPAPSAAAPSVTPDGELGVTLIGDSIGIGVTPALQQIYPKLAVEAKVSRQFYEARHVVQELLDNNALGPVVVIELGSNGEVQDSDMRDLIALIGPERKIIFVNVQVPRSWCAGDNAVLTKVASEYKNTVVADWYAASNGRDDYFGDDLVHPNEAGAAVMAKVIHNAVISLK